MILNEDFSKFFKELEIQNNKQWFDSQKKRFETACKEPFNELIHLVSIPLHLLDKHVTTQAKQAVFRIHRDIRFSKNKNPYKTNMAAAFTYSGKKDSSPAYYIHLDADYCMIGGGAYFIDKKDVDLIRKRIVSHKSKFLQIINHKDFVREFSAIQGDKNIIMPTHFKQAAKECELIKNKQFYVMKKVDISTFYKSVNQVNFILDTLLALKPLNLFIYEALRSEK